MRPRATGVAAARLLRNPKILSVAFQTGLCALVAAVLGLAVWNAYDHLKRANKAFGFGFWDVTAGFDISQTLIEYSAQSSTYGRAFWVGLLNTLLVSGLGIVFATMLGFLVGIGRLSRNWLVARLAGSYVETIRNIPLLLQLLFWYNAVLKALPELRDSEGLPGGVFLSNRGVYVPRPIFEAGFVFTLLALAVGLAAAAAFAHIARRHREQSGQQWPVASVSVVLVTNW